TELEPIYELMTDYLGQKSRMNILNQRLGVMQELVDMLANELDNQHSSKLEWIIILLIALEVILMLSKEYFHIL
ncbi:MAG: hypothetical protein KC414_12490, partial [Romboutsia sp.]|nr:hypothetical protein [Romboutsia sp.]